MNLMRAYFTENRDISSSDVLLQVVKESGIDVDTFEQTQAENEQQFSRQVFDDYNEATNLGINGVPAVVIDDQYLISGAVDVEHYQKALTHYRELRDAGTANTTMARAIQPLPAVMPSTHSGV